MCLFRDSLIFVAIISLPSNALIQSVIHRWMLWTSLNSFIFFQELCDKTSRLAIDSALAFVSHSKVIYLLFSGNVVHRSDPMDIDIDERPEFQTISLIDLNSNLKAPIDSSFTNGEEIILINVRIIFLLRHYTLIF